MITNVFKRIINELPNEIHKPFKGNKLANFITDEAKKIIKDNAPARYQNMVFKGSAGMGRWVSDKDAWIAIFNKNITTGASKGYYPVYGFPINSKFIRFGIGQAFEEAKQNYKKNWKEAINTIAKSSQLKIPSYSDRFSTGRPKLTTIDGKSYYTQGYVYYKLYDVNNLPEETELVEDLEIMLDAYDELFKKAGPRLDVSRILSPENISSEEIEGILGSKSIDSYEESNEFQSNNYKYPSLKGSENSSIFAKSGAKKRNQSFNNHKEMESVLAKILNENGYEPKQSPNPKTDIHWKTNEGIRVIEVKSVRQELHQIRQGIGQLIEYSYQIRSKGYQIDKCFLCLTSEPKRKIWEDILKSVGIILITPQNLEDILK
tara:strand:- start:85 stop:1209 length:1125 start_codon:yes stop_codon:yes gene_type:complete